MSGQTQEEGSPEPGRGGDDPLIGTLISDRYRVLDVLGQGGMGAVYRAEHVLMKKTVALKVLHAEMTERDTAVARFQREAQAAANIEHANICAATDFGRTSDGDFFLVIELLEGRTLHEALEQDGPFAPARAIHVAQQVCAALEEAHAQGVVHRDLKPDNVMLIERDGDPDFVKIMDFGVARLGVGEDDGAAATRLTQAGMVCGTPAYMAPEQAAADDVDAPADLYSLGVILFQMLSGRLPFESDSSAKLMAMQVTARPPTLRDVAPERAVPPELEALVAALLVKLPADRIQTAAATREALLAVDPDKVAAYGRPTGVLPASQPLPRGQGVVASSAPQPGGLAARWPWIAGALALFVGLPLLVLSLAGGDDVAAVARELGVARAQVAARPEVQAALGAKGKKARADALGELLAAAPTDAHLHAVAGLDAVGRKDWGSGLAQLSRALELDPRYGADPEVVGPLVERLGARSKADREAAAAVLTARKSPALLARVADAAAAHDKRAVRRRAKAFLEEGQHLDGLDDWRQAAVKLRHDAKGCKERKALITELEGSGEAGALGVLEGLAGAPKSGCGMLNMSDCYGCIRGDLSRAIKALKAD